MTISNTVGLRLYPKRRFKNKRKLIPAKVICTDRGRPKRRREAERTAREERRRAEKLGLPIIGIMIGNYGVERPVVGLKTNRHFTRALDSSTLVRVLFDNEPWTGG